MNKLFGGYSGMDINYCEYKISTNKNLISIDDVCDLLSKSYWANNRSREKIEKSIENSICVGIYIAEKMVGFARIVTDYATMYWLCDVIIDEEHRKNGLGKKMIEYIINMEELKDMFGILATKDAHKLYQKYGFEIQTVKYMRRDAKII